MKYSQLIGILAAVVLIISGYFHWTWYPDIEQYFTGFYTYNNSYGRPGRVFWVLCIVAIILFIVPRIWAKRFNMFVCVLTIAYALKTFIAFSACYRGFCPERQTGIWVMLSAAVIMFLASLLPDLKIKKS